MIVKAFSYEYFTKLRKWRRNRIVFLNGCFDLLHAGHIKLIKKAIRWANDNAYQLIVGINSDESIKSLGKNHPVIVDEIYRAMAIESLGVDNIVIFDEKDPTALLMSIVPDAIFKGDDYKGKDFPEKEFLKETGCVIFWDEKIPGLSTTNIFNKIAGYVKENMVNKITSDNKAWYEYALEEE